MQDKKGNASTRKVQGQKFASGTKPRNTPFSSLDELIYSPVHQQENKGKRYQNKLDQWAATIIGRPFQAKPYESEKIVSIRRVVYKYHYNVISLAYPVKTLRELKFCNYIVIRRSLIVVNGALLDVFQELFAFCIKRRKYHILMWLYRRYFREMWYIVGKPTSFCDFNLGISPLMCLDCTPQIFIRCIVCAFNLEVHVS